MRNNGSMMLMNALQNMRPRVPQFADAPEPQASIYAEKAANDGALGAWQQVTNLHDRAAGRTSAEGMNQASLGSALQRAIMADKRAAAEAAMRERLKGRELDQGASQFDREIGMKADQFDRDLGWKKERAPQEDALKRDLADKATARARAIAAGRAGATKPGKADDPEGMFKNIEDNMTRESGNLLKPDSFGVADAEGRTLWKQTERQKLQEKLATLRQLWAQYKLNRMDPKASAAILRRTAELFGAATQETMQSAAAEPEGPWSPELLQQMEMQAEIDAREGM